MITRLVDHSGMLGMLGMLGAWLRRADDIDQTTVDAFLSGSNDIHSPGKTTMDMPVAANAWIDRALRSLAPATTTTSAEQASAASAARRLHILLGLFQDEASTSPWRGRWSPGCPEG